MRPGTRLSTHEYDQRLDEIADALSGLYGQVQYGHAEHDMGTLRKLTIKVEVPGYGLDPRGALVFIEKHQRSSASDKWERFQYLYDLHMEPRSSGRFAYHWHDDVPHQHCVNPKRPRQDHHYAGPLFDDIGWAARELSAMISTGISCQGLHPLRDALPEPEEEEL